MINLYVTRYRPVEYDSEDGPWDPISGGASALLGTLGSLAMGFADFPVEIFKAMRSKPAENSKTEETSQSLSKSNNLESLNAHEKDTDYVPKADDSMPAVPIIPETSSLTDVSSSSTKDALERNEETRLADELSRQRIQDGTLHRTNSSLSETHEQESRKPRFIHRARTDLSSHQIHRTMSGSELSHIPLEAAVGAGRGIGRIVGAGLKSPMDFTLSLARGFHNAPKLYGDESVRQTDKITGIQSGLKAAGKVGVDSQMFVACY